MDEQNDTPRNIYVDRVWYVDDICDLYNNGYISWYKEKVFKENIIFCKVLVIERNHYGILNFSDIKNNNKKDAYYLLPRMSNQTIPANTRIYCKTEPNFYWIVKKRLGLISEYEIYPVRVLDEQPPLMLEEKIDALMEQVENLSYAAGMPKAIECGEHFKELVEKQ